MLPLTLLFALQSAASAAAVGEGRDAVVQREAWAMGTRVTLHAEAEDTGLALRATEMVLAEVERLESLLSSWTDATEIGRLNRAPIGESVVLSEELHALLVDARGWAGATGGAFEPAVGALVDAWDLRGAGRVPGERLLTRARSAAGPAVFELGASRATATRREAEGWIDTGGFGKGAALRAAVDRLGRGGLDDVRILADLGGQLWAGASAERPWTVPVAHPVDRGRPAAELRLHGVSVATSGGSERWVEVDGTRYGHILDPRTGRPAPAWGTVSVVHSDPMAADVLATALFVMGPEEGMRWLARHPDVAALFLDARRGVVEPRWTPAMDAWLVRIAQQPDLEHFSRHRSVISFIKTLPLAAVALAACLSLTPARAAAQEPDSARITELERQIEAVTRELERMQLGGDVVEADTAIGGLPFGASKVYQVQRGVSIGGYGEILYENYAGQQDGGAASGATDQFDALRAILYVGYKFNDRVLFNSEIEIEHATEAFLEFAYVDYLLTESVGLRGGLLLAPMGLVNELHEPPYFLGTKRSQTESRIIPTTWRENGVGLFGAAGGIEWRAYLMNSFDGGGFSGSGLRGGRQKGGQALAEDLGFAGRVDYTAKPGLRVGASAFFGETAQNRTVGGDPVGGDVLIWDVHADYRVRGWVLRGLVAGARVGDVAEMNALNGLTGANGIGSEMLGWYGEVGYDVLRSADTGHELLPFVRYEKLNTQRDVATGFAANPANDMTVASFGVAWKPVPQVVWKLGWTNHANEADTGVDQWDVQLGWLF